MYCNAAVHTGVGELRELSVVQISLCAANKLLGVSLATACCVLRAAAAAAADAT